MLRYSVLQIHSVGVAFNAATNRELPGLYAQEENDNDGAAKAS
jgi:hypothetical protein